MNTIRVRKKIYPYLYQTPSISLLIILMVIPMLTVINYSFFDNVIMKKSPNFVGLSNYKEILSDNTFWISFYNTIYCYFFNLFLLLIFKNENKNIIKIFYSYIYFVFVVQIFLIFLLKYHHKHLVKLNALFVFLYFHFVYQILNEIYF